MSKTLTRRDVKELFREGMLRAHNAVIREVELRESGLFMELTYERASEVINADLREWVEE